MSAAEAAAAVQSSPAYDAQEFQTQQAMPQEYGSPGAQQQGEEMMQYDQSYGQAALEQEPVQEQQAQYGVPQYLSSDAAAKVYSNMPPQPIDQAQYQAQAEVTEQEEQSAPVEQPYGQYAYDGGQAEAPAAQFAYSATPDVQSRSLQQPSFQYSPAAQSPAPQQYTAQPQAQAQPQPQAYSTASPYPKPDVPQQYASQPYASQYSPPQQYPPQQYSPQPQEQYSSPPPPQQQYASPQQQYSPQPEPYKQQAQPQYPEPAGGGDNEFRNVDMSSDTQNALAAEYRKYMMREKMQQNQQQYHHQPQHQQYPPPPDAQAQQPQPMGGAASHRSQMSQVSRVSYDHSVQAPVQPPKDNVYSTPPPPASATQQQTSQTKKKKRCC